MYEQCFIPQHTSQFDFCWSGPAAWNLQHWDTLDLRSGESCLHEREGGVGKASHVASSEHLFATSTMLVHFALSNDVPLTRLHGHLQPGPPHPPGLHAGSKNISALKTEHAGTRTCGAKRTCQAAKAGIEEALLSHLPFLLCMEMDLSWVICERLKLISLAPWRPLLGNNIGFSSELLGGRHRAGALCVFPSLLGASLWRRSYCELFWWGNGRCAITWASKFPGFRAGWGQENQTIMAKSSVLICLMIL